MNIRFIGLDVLGYKMASAHATDVFSKWALMGKDEGMEKGHYPSVKAMLDIALRYVKTEFTAIDLGCGNGWVVRLLNDLGAKSAEGVDGSIEMIKKATAIDPSGNYTHGLLPDWQPRTRFDLVHSMEFLYYLENPENMLKKIRSEWLQENGILVAGVDHYLENEESLSWPEHVGVHMTTMSITEWKNAMHNAGFVDVEIHQIAAKLSLIHI